MRAEEPRCTLAAAPPPSHFNPSAQTLFMYQRFCIKEALRVTKMAESIIYAQELAVLPFKKDSVGPVIGACKRAQKR